MFSCNLKADEGYSQPCETGQTFGDSSHVIADDVIFILKSAQAVAAINDFIEENYCEPSTATNFQVCIIAPVNYILCIALCIFCGQVMNQ